MLMLHGWTLGLSLVSSLSTLSSLVLFFDRPRGELLLPPSSFRVSESRVPGAGLGLFAASELAAGADLGYYPGVLLPTPAFVRTKRGVGDAESYCWKLQDERGVLDPTDEQGALQELCAGGSRTVPLSHALFKLLPLSKPTLLCRINEPPASAAANVDTEEEGDTVRFFVTKDVLPGEELYLDYGAWYDRSGYNH